jgi:hypothetical protein
MVGVCQVVFPPYVEPSLKQKSIDVVKERI